MSSASLRQNAADLAWSLWSELGVSGVVRHHAAMAIDLEPLLAATPALGAHDPRLLEQALSWCALHADRVNSTRLTSLVAALSAGDQARFRAFGATANSVAGTTWPASGEPWRPLPTLRSVPLPVERLALVRLRGRALCGVGTRADVLCDLLARSESWSTAAMLAERGHSKRNIARVLSEFESGGIVVRHASGNELHYRPSHPEALAAVLGGLPSVHPDWIAIFRFVLTALELGHLEGAAAPVRRVEANTRRDALARLADVLRFPGPPETRGNPDAWRVVVAWASAELGTLADGRSPAMAASTTSPRPPRPPRR